jgi:putative ABC transport system permease protein
MNLSIQIIPFTKLALAFIPVAIVIGILFRWTRGYKTEIYGFSRMLGQLLLVGYFLSTVFESDSAWIVLLVIIVMVFASSSIALRTVKEQWRQLYWRSFVAILIGGGVVLTLITQGVLELEPWYLPSYFIPLAGMIFANAMNSVSLAADRLYAEAGRDVPFEKARNIALRASLIPMTNALFAVGLVSLPGMMTGQILSGVSPLIAVRYQIMVMCMVFGAAGISSAIFLTLVKTDFPAPETIENIPPT